MTFSKETCRCEKQLQTNWRKFPPYVNNTDAPHPGGILPGIVDDMAVKCCQTCKSHGQSVIDFKLDGDGELSQKSSDSALRASISQKTEFNFPIPGYIGQERYGNELFLSPYQWNCRKQLYTAGSVVRGFHRSCPIAETQILDILPKLVS